MAQASAKREQIDQSVSTMVTIASVAVFVAIFSLISAHTLWSKLSFQNKVINDKTTARNQLQTDVVAAKKLTSSYENFNQASTNLLGGTVTGKDNDNAKIVLDALPSDEDYPALSTSIENLLSNQGVNIDNIGGGQSTTSTSSGFPSASTSVSSNSATPMSFTFSIDGPYQNIQNVVNTFEKSIRPFQFQTMDLSGSQSDLTLSVTAQTFYQPATTFKVTTEKVQ